MIADMTPGSRWPLMWGTQSSNQRYFLPGSHSEVSVAVALGN